MPKTEVRERPLLCRDSVVRAILEGRQTQDRRPVKPQPPERGDNGGHLRRIVLDPRFPETGDCDAQYELDNPRRVGRSPFGQPGDVLWCREAWSPDHAAFYPNFPIVYRAEGYDPRLTDRWGNYISRAYSPEANCEFDFRWRPSIHMPCWACRLRLRVLRVWVERLQDISEEDAAAEGVERATPHSSLYAYRDSFAKLWDECYGQGAWDRNDWVWACEFEKLEAS